MEINTLPEQWWIAGFGDTLIWARLRILEEGNAEVFDCDGRIQGYPDEDAARAALLDAEFRAFDGLDEQDANEMGFSLENIFPPEVEDGEDLIPFMTQRIARKN